MSDFSLGQLANMQLIKKLLESHQRLSGLPYALYDKHIRPENLIMCTGWQDICLRFNRQNPVTAAACRECDESLLAQLQTADFAEHICFNGLIDIAAPIVVGGKPRAILSTGQFFYDDNLPDLEYFIKRAERIGFDVNEYINALERVPVFNRQHIRNNFMFIRNLIQAFAEGGLKSLEIGPRMDKNNRPRERHLTSTRSPQSREHMKSYKAQDQNKVEPLDHAFPSMNQGNAAESPLINTDYSHNPDVSRYVRAQLLNLSEYTQSERQLLEREKQQSTLLMPVDYGIVFQAANGEIIAVNPTAERILGRVAAEMVGKTLDDMHCRPTGEDGTPLSDQQTPSMISLRTGKPQTNVSMSIRRPDGELVWISVNAQPLIAPEKMELNTVKVTFYDTTKYMLAKEELTTREREFHARMDEHAKLAELSEYIGCILTKNDDIHCKLNECAQTLVNRLDAALVRIWTLDAAPDILKLQASAGMSTEVDVSHIQMSVAEFMSSRVSKTRKRHISDAMVQDALSDYKEWAEKKGLAEFVGYPLILEEKLVGVIMLVFSRHIDDVTIQTLIALSGKIALCIERKLIESTLFDSDHVFSTLEDHSPYLIARYDKEFSYIYINQLFIREANISTHQEQYITLDVLWPSGANISIEQFKAKLHQVMETGDSIEFQLEWTSPITGHAVCHPCTIVGQKDHEDKIIGYITIGNSIDENKLTEEKLHAQQQMLANITMELCKSEEQERRRISSNLHDNIGQTLLLGKIKLGLLIGKLPTTNSREELEEILGLQDQVIQAVRSLSQQLCPPVLHNVGLEAALKWLAKRMEEDYCLKITFVDDQAEKTLSKDMCCVIFQSCRELLINVSKHAKCEFVQVVMSRKEDRLHLMVKDSGVGFDLTAETTAASSQVNGLGLFIVKQRIVHLGGEVTITSSPGKGTSVVISVPLAPDMPHESQLPSDTCKPTLLETVWN